MEFIKTIKTTSSTTYIYREDEKLFAFKPSGNIEKEILANKLARIFGVRTLKAEPAEIKGKKGIRTDYMETGILLSCKKELNKTQIQELKKIILFDIFVGNKDRHTANIFANEHLTAFDHDKIFSRGNARKFIKLDIGRKLREDFIDIIEKLVDKKLSIKNVLIKLGFKEKDFPKMKREDIINIVKDKQLLGFLCSRTDFSRIKF